MEWILAVGVVAVAIFLFKKRKRPAGAVRAALEKLGAEYKIIGDVQVSSPKGMLRLDHAAVSPYGIFVITEVKESGNVRGNASEREWSISREETIYNPLWRNRTLVNALEEKLGKNKYLPIVVFANASLKQDYGKDAVEYSGLIPRIRFFTNPVMSPEQVEEIINRLHGLRG